MATIQRNFVLGKMNKSLDERLVPNGEYVDALNIRLGSTEDSEVGSVENSKGNEQLTTLVYLGQVLSPAARCIGAYQDGANETIYWFVHDPSFPLGATGKLDLIVSFNTLTQALTYHVITIDDGAGVNTTLNFNPQYLITGINLIDNAILFWTDDYNPPRQINVTRSYPNPVGLIDQTSAESLLVIKKPPLTSPTVVPVQTTGENNFLEDRFVSFGYRYRYADNQYSATSQFSTPSFLPSPFNYDFTTGLNDGMLNATNTSLITYNSGGPLVLGIDLLWKDMQTGNIRVITKLDKSILGLVDNTDYTFTFSNSKIFTLLPESEILRLYDNVPRLAKAQTIMGNRLVYGNYLEQYDLISVNGFPTRLEYVAELVSEEIGFTDIPTGLLVGQYTWDGYEVINDATFTLQNVDSLNLKAGSAIEIYVRFQHSKFTGDTTPPATSMDVEINFLYILPQDFATAYDLATSVDFIDKVQDLQPVATSCGGISMTDIFSCQIPQTLGSLTKYEIGIDGPNEPIRIITSPASPDISFQLPVMRFVDDPTGVAITQNAYEYYEIVTASASFQEIGNPKSLHSNRSYEVGIVYMDDFNRATTALVSDNNTVHVPCSLSDQANRIRVTIPSAQNAPNWATRYKLVIKPDKENYFTIYSNIFFVDPITSATYFLLEGQNARKVEEGDVLIVKKDTSGATLKCAYATVLEKKAQQADFLDPAPEDSNGNPIPIPAGTYIKMRANEFSTDVGDLPIIAFGTLTYTAGGLTLCDPSIPSYINCPIAKYPVRINDGTGTWIDYDIPAGSRINIRVENERKGKDCPYGVERRYYLLDVSLVSQANYPDFKSWWDGDNVQSILNSAAIREADCGEPIPTASYNPILLQTPTDYPCSAGCSLGVINYQFFLDNTTTEKFLIVTGTFGYPGKNQLSKLSINIEVIINDALIVFETQPQDALPDVWYESSESYAIDLATGYHTGNVQNQTSVLPAIIDTDFFNCYAFGNGVESYKVRDAIDGKELLLGNRVTSTSSQDYQEIRRFADLTYSGVYNDETNVNKLNEFNLGLLNFKPLEDRYGPVYIIDGRRTDILVLQEDKISYVLAEKNLLTDSTGESVVTSVPEVLGTQVARSEEYGISFHPESYAKWGYDKFFTDAKRGAVLQLRGYSSSNEQLSVISEQGMRSWFRDSFIEAFNTQKLGGYDPYMDEYVLSSNNILLPEAVECLPCGLTRTITVKARPSTTFCVDVGGLVGEVNIGYFIVAVEANVQIEATYDGTTVSTGFVNNSSGSPLVVNKDSVAVSTIDLEVSTDVGEAIIEITVECPSAQTLRIIQVCFSNNNEAGQFIHNEYRWVDGLFVSPLHSSQVQLISGTTNPLVSQYETIVGPQGGGFIPADGATVSIISNSIAPIDDYVFNPAVDSFRYLRSNTLYLGSSPVDMAALLAASIPAVPVTGGGNTYQADFIMPLTNEQYLYLIYNYRDSVEVGLCYDAVDEFAVCCLCTDGNNLIVRECNAVEAEPNITIVANLFAANVGDFVEISTGGEGCVWEVIGETTDPSVGEIVTIRADITDCSQVCAVYRLTSSNLEGGVFGSYYDCEGNTIEYAIYPSFGEPPIPGFIDICATGWPSLPVGVTAEKIGCVCPDNLLVQRCGDDLQEVIPAGTALIGQFITLTGYSSECIWEVLTYTAQEPTDTLATLTGITSCDEVCNNYTYLNLSGVAFELQYVDCNGDPQIITGTGEGSGTFCALYIVSSTEGLVVGTNYFEPCGCNENLLVQQCRLDGVVQTEVIPANFANIGDFVQNFDAGCTYEVIAYTTDPVTIPTPTLTPITSCDEACDTYTVTNNSAVEQSFAYVDCNGIAQNSPNIPAGGNITLCLQQIDLPFEFTIAFLGCGCGE